MDLFAYEQKIYDDASNHAQAVHEGTAYNFDEFRRLLKEYGQLLKHLRRVTRINDKTTTNLHESNLDLVDKVHHDELTGIYNRRYMQENLKRMIKSLSRSNSLLTVVLLDVDYFKNYNDTYGHTAGDACLKAIAEILTNTLTREDDFVARYGGEEFIIILPHTDEHGAHMIASRLLESAVERNILHEQSEVADCVTFSIGITTIKVKHTHKIKDYIQRADEALYISKNNGRNRYTFLKFAEAIE